MVGCSHLFEIGFNAGHSALLALEHTQIDITSIDCALHPYTKPAADFLVREFPQRFMFKKMDSRDLFDKRATLEFGNFDIWHIDGGHSAEAFANDIQAFLCLSMIGCRVLIDDFYVGPINAVTKHLVDRGYLEQFDDVYSSESAAFIVRRTCNTNSRAEFDSRVKELVSFAGKP